MISDIITDCIKILLVEDHLGDVQLTQEMLSEASPNGFKLTHVSSARKAVMALGSEHCDVVLLDLSLPDTFGLETVNSILEVAPSVPIVVLSGSSNERLAMQTMQRGVQDYLVKGQIEGHLLIRTLRHAIERKRLLESVRKQAFQLELLVEELERVSATKNEFVSFVAHELKTPMISAELSLNRLAVGKVGPLNEQQQKYISMLQRSVSRVSTLIHEVLNLSCIESGRLKLQYKDADLRALLVEATSQLAPLAQERRCVVLTEEPQAPLLARCDPDKIIQILVNLAGNSIMHNENGTTIVVGAKRAGQRVHVWVHDEGRGISKEEQKRIFRPFGQVKTDDGKISGLGLAISKALVEAHGGRILLVSDEGKGCTFSFDLEAVNPTSDEHERQQSG